MPEIPLFPHLFSVYKNNVFMWNDYFRFVVFFSLSPMVVVFYVIFNTLKGFAGKVTWDDMSEFFILINRSQAICKEIKGIFNEFDIDKDHKLSLQQLFNFLFKVSRLFEPLYIFRKKIINYVFGEENVIIILQRKAKMNSIREYMHNNGKYPPEPCKLKIKRIIQHKPNPSSFNYSDDNIQYQSCFKEYLRLFKPSYTFKSELFKMTFLGKFNDYPFLARIDKFYIEYRAQNRSNSIINHNSSSFLSHSLHYSQSFKKKSILKLQSNLNSRRSSLLYDSNKADDGTSNDVSSDTYKRTYRSSYILTPIADLNVQKIN